MKEVKTIGLDLAKSVFYIHGVDAAGKTILKKKLSRSKVLPFFANLPSCVVGMEAGGGSNYWAREILALGHEAKLIAPQFVKPYVKTNKTDANDAEAICEAVARPNMRFVPVKTVDQQDLQSIHRIRKRLVQARTSLANEIRGFLGEYGIVFPTGIRKLIKELPQIIADQSNQLTPMTRRLMLELNSEFLEVTERLESYNDKINLILKNHEVASRLATVPGVGPLAATAIVASAADPQSFKNGREYSAYLGLVPKQCSSGGIQKNLGISKRGDRYIRTMLIHGARAWLAHTTRLGRTDKRSRWALELKERRGHNKAIVAIANKNARVLWALMANGEAYSAA